MLSIKGMPSKSTHKEALLFMLQTQLPRKCGGVCCAGPGLIAQKQQEVTGSGAPARGVHWATECVWEERTGTAPGCCFSGRATLASTPMIKIALNVRWADGRQILYQMPYTHKRTFCSSSQFISDSPSSLSQAGGMPGFAVPETPSADLEHRGATVQLSSHWARGAPGRGWGPAATPRGPQRSSTHPL